MSDGYGKQFAWMVAAVIVAILILGLVSKGRR